MHDDLKRWRRLVEGIVMRESINRRTWTLYHASDGPAFSQFDQQCADKQPAWNPLGHGMYCTNDPEHARSYGRNLHKVIIPAGSRYRRFNPETWARTGLQLIMDALQQALTTVGEHKAVEPFRARAAEMLRNYSPYLGLEQSVYLLDEFDFSQQVGTVYMQALPELATELFGQYDFIVFPDRFDSRVVEVVIFNPALQKTT